MENPLEQAQELMLWGNYEEAQNIFLSLLEHDPESDVLLYHLGLCNLSFEYFEEAISYLKACLQVNTRHVDALIDLGDAWLSLDNSDEARIAFERAFSIAPQEPRVIISMAHFYDYLENYPKAVELYERAMTIADPSDAPRYELALAYGKVGRFLEADILLEVLITESLRRGTQSFIGDWNAASREDLAGSIREMREEREFIAQDHEKKKGYDIYYARLMYHSLRHMRSLEPQILVDLYREIKALQLFGVDTALAKSHYRLNSLQGTFSGVHLGCFLYACSKELNLDGPGDPLLVLAYEDARGLFAT